MAAPVCVSAPVVSGAGETEVLERIRLSVPALLTAIAPFLPATLVAPVLKEVVVLSQRVTITDCEVFNGKVLVNGLLHKNLLLKVFPTTTSPALTGAVIGGGDCTVAVGTPVDLAVDCSFGACIPVPGACPGDHCQIERACIDAEKELLIDTTGTGMPNLFEEKVCILLQVKTIRNTQVTITPNAVNICPTFPPPSVCPPTGCIDGLLPSSKFISRPGGAVV